MQPETPDNDGGGAPAGRGRGGWRFSITLIVLFVGMAGLAASAAGVSAQLLPRKFTPSQQQQIGNWETARRWRALPAGKIFPDAITYQVPSDTLNAGSQLALTAYRVGIARELSCGKSADAAADRVLSAGHCTALLRATYADETDSMLVTVGVAVMPGAGAAKSAASKLSAPPPPQPGVRTVSFRFTLARAFGDRQRQLSWAVSSGPYVIMSTAGYADGAPRMQLASNQYADQEMTSFATGAADAVGAPLQEPPDAGAAAAFPHDASGRRAGAGHGGRRGPGHRGRPGPGRLRARGPDVGAERDQRPGRVAAERGTGRDRRGDRQRREPGGVRSRRFGHHRAGPDRRRHAGIQPQLGHARNLDGLADRRPWSRRWRQRHHRGGADGARTVDPRDHQQRRSRVHPVPAAATGPSPARAGFGDYVRDIPRGGRHQHVAGLRPARTAGAVGPPGRAEPRHRGPRLIGQLRRHLAGQEPGARALLVPGRLPGSAGGSGRGTQRRPGDLLQRQPVRAGRRPWRGCPR